MPNDASILLPSDDDALFLDCTKAKGKRPRPQPPTWTYLFSQVRYGRAMLVLAVQSWLTVGELGSRTSAFAAGLCHRCCQNAVCKSSHVIYCHFHRSIDTIAEHTEGAVSGVRYFCAQQPESVDEASVSVPKWCITRHFSSCE